MSQQVIPYRMNSTTPLKVSIGVGDEDSRLCLYHCSSSPLSIDAGCVGYFGKDLPGGGSAADQATIAASVSGSKDPDFEFMGVGNGGGPSPWFDIPTNTAFIVLYSAVNARGIIVIETMVHAVVDCPCGRTHHVKTR